MARTEYETHEHDVIVIGAGGAGLRAAIEAAAQGVSVGLICKSLLGKAHTVMAEGGMAAALGRDVELVGQAARAVRWLSTPVTRAVDLCRRPRGHADRR